MRRKDREITDFCEIENVVANARYMHLGLFDGDFPYVVPLHYGYKTENGKFVFYVHCAAEGHKLDCLKKNGNVFVEIDCGESLIAGNVPCEYGAEYQSVMCRGTAAIVENPTEKREGLEILMRTQTGAEHPISEKMAEAVTVVRIDTENCTAKARVKK